MFLYLTTTPIQTGVLISDRGLAFVHLVIFIMTDLSGLIKSGSADVIFILFSCDEGQRPK